MSGRPGADSKIMSHRKSAASDEEPLVTEPREAVETTGQLVLNIPATARRVLDIERGDTLDIEIYDDHYRVVANNED